MFMSTRYGSLNHVDPNENLYRYRSDVMPPDLPPDAPPHRMVCMLSYA